MALILPLASEAKSVKHPVPVIHNPVVSVKSVPKKLGLTKKTAPKKPENAVKNSVSGIVAAVRGTSITLTLADGSTDLIDVSQAKLIEAMDVPGITFASIRIGDRLKVIGRITNGTVAAKTVSDSALTGRDIFRGTVTAASGTLVSVNLNGDKSKNYPVDVSAAAITKGSRNGATASAADIKVGDRLALAGTMNGTTIIATAVRDLAPIHKSTGKRFNGSR